ncbi:MAG: DoxX family membrane protein [Actinobacteria bacterium]|nr:DoxX family membrane protein [Actinomycetota bacterium]
MESAALPRHSASGAAASRPATADAGYQAFLMLRIGFAVAPIAFGLDKFFNVLVHWPQYLAPWIDRIVPGSAQSAMYAVGVIEIAAGLLVALKPRYGAPLVAAWLAGIVVNLLTFSGWYDIALRDFGLMVGALALTRMAWHYDPPLRRTS